MNCSRICLLLILLGFSSCNEEKVDFISYQPRVAVEGSIEEGGYASVLLSVTVPMEGVRDTLELLDQVIRSARVTVSDGETSELLSLVTNYDRIPPYEYRGSELRGQVGKNYSLKVEYRNKVISADTYIPQAVELDSVWFKKTTDSEGYIYIKFVNSSEGYYLISTRVLDDQKRFVPCLYGNIDSRLYDSNESVVMQINKGPAIFPVANYKTSFEVGKRLAVRLSAQPRAAYEFWSSYQNEVVNTQNPIFPANTGLHSNIHGGIGLWSGYASSIRYIDPR